MGPHEGPTLQYRRIEGLERDPLVSAFSQHPLIMQIHEHYYGDLVSARRPILMNKPAGRSTPLPWHQDVPTGPRSLAPGTPIVNIWTAIDTADESNGCMRMVPSSHKHGILNAGSFTSEENVAKYCTEDAIVPIPVPAGHAVMFNNCTLHSSGVNTTADRNRRAMVIRPLFDMSR
jgi:phytanoyl-CoA hydroxylase